MTTNRDPDWLRKVIEIETDGERSPARQLEIDTEALIHPTMLVRDVYALINNLNETSPEYEYYVELLVFKGTGVACIKKRRRADMAPEYLR